VVATRRDAQYHPPMRTPAFILLFLPACRDGDDTGTPTVPDDTAITSSEATLGVSCAPTELAGWVTLAPANDQLYLGGVVYNAPQPLTGVPTIDNQHCAFHHYDSSGCATCEAPLVCAGDGSCVPQPVAFGDLHVVARADGVTEFAESDPTTGLLSAQFDGEDKVWALELNFGQDRVTVPAMPVADGAIGVTVAVESSDETAPGALTVSWTPAADGSVVRTEVPINHHAAPGTFTRCEADVATGSFTASAEMVDPLAVITGLEFQGVEHLQVASAQTSVGCVELRYGSWIHVDPSYGR
jgi:hypothetical protein